MRPSRQTFAGSAFAALAVWLVVFHATAGEPDNSISLSGTWRFRLDPAGVGITNQWFKQTLEDSVILPATTGPWTGLVRVATLKSE